MDFQVHANGSGKRVMVADRIGGGQVFNQFLAPDQLATVTVASNDGLTGDIDVSAQMQANSPTVIVKTDYSVRTAEILEIDDV